MSETVLHGDSRVPELDGIRGLAIGTVLVWHLYIIYIEVAPRSALAYFQAAGRLAWSGVDLFFVLSGFLIGGILLDNRSATNYFKVFYTRRFLRIIPAYFLCVGLVYLLMHFVMSGAIPTLAFLKPVNVIPWTPHIFFVQSFWMAAKNAGGILGITWSLAIEEQFYLTLPLLVRLLSPKTLLVTVSTVILAAPVCRTALLLFWPGHSNAAYVLLPCRADALMLGVLGAIALRSPVWKTRLANKRLLMRILLAFFTLGLIVFTKIRLTTFGLGMQTFGYTWLAVFYLSLLLYVVSFPQGRIARAFRWNPLRKLGTIAYGAYLFHMYVLWSVYGYFYSSWPKITGWKGFALSSFVALATLLFCQISWVYFEKPLVQLGQRVRYRFDLVSKSEVLLAPETVAQAK